MSASDIRGLEEVISDLEQEFSQRLLTDDVIATASAATRRALADRTHHESVERRARAYFSAVVRRKVAVSRSNRGGVARLLAGSVVDDLIASGRSRTEALEELERGWSDKLPDSIIEEYRERLCA